MGTWRLSKLQAVFVLPLTAGALIPLFASGDQNASNNAGDRHEPSPNRTVEVLYEGRLVHDQDWTIKAGPAGPDNQKFRGLGGTCSMVSADVHEVIGSSHESVTFESKPFGLGLWKMVWSDAVAGIATDGNNYTYIQRHEFSGPTTDGRAPRPSRGRPRSEDTGFLQVVPSNVNTDALDTLDIFILQSPRGGVVANSRIHWTWRLQIPPVANDPPPAFFPFLFQNYMLNIHDQLSGQLGCDPL